MVAGHLLRAAGLPLMHIQMDASAAVRQGRKRGCAFSTSPFRGIKPCNYRYKQMAPHLLGARLCRLVCRIPDDSEGIVIVDHMMTRKVRSR